VTAEGRAPRSPVRAELGQFLRFCAVGAVGFCIDAAVLMLCLHLARLDPLSGRLVSFTTAVLATFALNRHWAFRRSRRASYLTGLIAYVMVQGAGFTCNLAVYTALYLLLPSPFNAPIFCLVVASGAALLVNYGGARFAVFAAASPGLGHSP
jgi:putative flippase GtrA